MNLRLGLLAILLLAFVASAEDYRYESRTVSDPFPTPAAAPRGTYDVVHVKDMAELKRTAIPLFVGNWEQAQSSSAIFRMGWNDSGLLIHAEVFDDQVSPGNEIQSLWRSDSVEIYLDLRERSRRTSAYMDDPSNKAGQLGLAPVSQQANQPDVARLARGSGSLDGLFSAEGLSRGFRRTESGYEVWITIPRGTWLIRGGDILADFALIDRGDNVGGHHFAFGEDFDWKMNNRFGLLRFVDETPLAVQMATTSTMGVMGPAGSTEVYEDVICVVYATSDLAAIKFQVSPENAILNAHTEVASVQVGENHLYRLKWTGRNSSLQAINFTVADPQHRVTRQWPATVADYKALLTRIVEERAKAPADHPSQVLYDIAREDVLCAMSWRRMTGPELVRAVKQEFAIAHDMQNGMSHPRMTLGGYYSQGQQRWLPYAVFAGETKSDGTMGAEVYLHGSSGFDFSRGSFLRQKLEDADRMERDHAPLPKRAMIFFYGAGNDYHLLGQDDWKYVPQILAKTQRIDPQDVHLRGHSMGGGATYYYGARIAGLSPTMPFRSFTPAAAVFRGIEGDSPGNDYDQFNNQRNSLHSLVENYQKRPFLLVHGILDRTVPVSNSRNALQWLRSQDIPADILEIPAQGHGPRGFEEIRDVWLSRQKAVPISAWSAYELRFAEVNGVRADCFEVWGKPASMRFPSAGTIETENVAVLDLSQWQGDWPINVNGRQVAKDHPIWLLDDSFKMAVKGETTFKTRWNCGPIREIGRRGFVIVTGTQVPEHRKMLHDLSRKIRDSILGSEWGLKEDDLKIYQDTDANIPTDICVIVVGTAAENAYAARRADPVADLVTAIGKEKMTAKAGVIMLRPDSHLLVQGDRDFYEALLASRLRSPLPLDCDYQLWRRADRAPVPWVEGEFDEKWNFSQQLMRIR